MRTDEEGNLCPSTLGEYRKLCAEISGEGCKSVAFLDQKIADSPNGENEEVIVADSQMRMVLIPMMFETVIAEENAEDPQPQE